MAQHSDYAPDTQVLISVLDQISQRYGLTPTQSLEQLTTFDLEVMTVSIGYENYRNQQAQGKKPVPRLSQQDMRAMLEAVRHGDKKDAG